MSEKQVVILGQKSRLRILTKLPKIVKPQFKEIHGILQDGCKIFQSALLQWNFRPVMWPVCQHCVRFCTFCVLTNVYNKFRVVDLIATGLLIAILYSLASFCKDIRICGNVFCYKICLKARRIFFENQTVVS